MLVNPEDPSLAMLYPAKHVYKIPAEPRGSLASLWDDRALRGHRGERSGDS